MIRLKEHVGVVLRPSSQGFDAGASTFASLFKERTTENYYLYYTGSADTKWSQASIGVAESQDGLNFVKHSNNPVVSLGRESVTPALCRANGRYWMIFAYKMRRTRLPFVHEVVGRTIGAACADDPLGPWRLVEQLAKPEANWEGNIIDLGPSIAVLNEDEFLVFYSNVPDRLPRSLGPISVFNNSARRIGLLKLKIRGSGNIEVEKWDKNPLGHLNGSKGSWNESLFCPGYFNLGNKHYLLPAASTYTTGFPYRQYIGLIEDSSPFFEHPSLKRILINGPQEKTALLPNARSEIALDTPSPVIRGNELWLYYAIMDRADGIWKTALSIFSIE